MNALVTPHGNLPLPAFLPDATRAAVRTLDAGDVAETGIRALMVNALHLSNEPGASLVAGMGGVHRFMGWDGPIASDSGGFQAYSLSIGAEKLGTVSAKGFTYRLAKGDSKKILTPEKCIQKQFQLGSDILFCLDHCTHPEADAASQRESVRHTVDWARQCKTAFLRRIEEQAREGPQPLLFGIVQGGSDPALRRECAEELMAIGFDGYGYGGWPIGSDGMLVEAVAQVAELTSGGGPRHALGIGKPENVVAAFRAGYRLFDCTIPTRDARHKRLYAFTDPSPDTALTGKDFYRSVNIGTPGHARDPRPIEESCDCACCRRYSMAYLHHLFNAGEPLGPRLATIHNLHFYARLMERLRRDEDHDA